VHLVGFIIRIYHDVWSPERHISKVMWSTDYFIARIWKWKYSHI